MMLNIGMCKLYVHYFSEYVCHSGYFVEACVASLKEDPFISTFLHHPWIIVSGTVSGQVLNNDHVHMQVITSAVSIVPSPLMITE